MRCARLALPALALLVLAASARADTYQDLRRNASVSQAVDAMPGGINGSLTRLSNSLDDATFADMTPALQRRITSALEAAEQDLRNGLPSLDIVNRLAMALTLQRLAIPVIPALFPNHGMPPCDPGYADWHGVCHATPTLAADRIAELFEGSIRAGVDDYRLKNPAAVVPPVPPAPVPGIAADNFGAWLEDTLVALSGAIDGVEHIDVQ